jgi:hypothetical protein
MRQIKYKKIYISLNKISIFLNYNLHKNYQISIKLKIILITLKNNFNSFLKINFKFNKLLIKLNANANIKNLKIKPLYIIKYHSNIWLNNDKYIYRYVRISMLVSKPELTNSNNL